MVVWQRLYKRSIHPLESNWNIATTAGKHARKQARRNVGTEQAPLRTQADRIEPRKGTLASLAVNTLREMVEELGDKTTVILTSHGSIQ